MSDDDANLRRLQRAYYMGAAAIASFTPLIYVQGQVTRWKVGVLPDAAGPTSGTVGEGDPTRLLVMGESTVAGLGAREHKRALAGQFAARLSEHLGRSVEWHVVGKSGVTARQTIDELLPKVPEISFDHILLGIGGNDVMKLSSPRRWRRDMLELIGRLNETQPGADIFISNCPMIIYSPIMPEPIRSILWRLSQMHDANIREFTAPLERVTYYPQPARIEVDGFFADGIHPSEQGYADWARAMMEYFAEHHPW